MKFTRLVAIALITSAMGAGSLGAQTRPGSEPSEFPPASYKGKQYVDSKGCVFIRAGIDGNVSWVPRVTRKRSGVCGFKPTFAGKVTEPEPVQTASAVQITIPEVKAKPAVAAPKPKVKPRPARVAKAAPKPKPKVVRQVAKRPAPIVEKTVQPVLVQPAPVRRAVTVAQAGQSACAGASPISQQYLRRGAYDVRCGPQTTPIVGARISSAPAPRTVTPYVAPQPMVIETAPVQVSKHRRIVPRHVAVNRVNTTNVKVPRGYKQVWTDGRLNPKRAEQTLAGHEAMSLIWTSTVPRRLINQADGQDVTASVPLVYPYTDYVAQQKELGQVTIVQRNGQTLKRIVRNVAGVFSPEPGQARVATVQRQPTYSSRSAPKVAPKATARRIQPKGEVAGRGFVQVGQFADTAAAHRLAQKVQRMGLPVRVGRYTRNGQTTRLVIAGPFGGERDVNRAVSRLRGAGYNAFAR
ncbi:SPOR domain-containing protein [Sulfitobacter sp. F26169L]|uniref:SPOR domain-containing protein n=1 Tax=Sulfitobacter sp. F26169L TaxID=2996015 RepID=UPI00226098F5|nr:SPOR domain-containing protein [Sulfitobacter sp. F26169L]MCX7567028.1 SPOR domain-containing protein [Sulfitobacter sp. F26169L]